MVLRDHGGSLTIDSVAFGNAAQLFTKCNSDEINFGTTEDAVWVRFIVKNDGATNSDWLISENYSIIDTVAFYVPSSDGSAARQSLAQAAFISSSKFNKIIAGTVYPMKERAVPSRLFVFPFHLGPSERKTFYLRFHSNSDLPVNLSIWKPSAFSNSEANRNLLFGLFYGALLIMAFYNLFLFFSVKDLSYLYYSLYALFVGYYQFCMDGLRYRFLFPNDIALVNLDIIASVWIGASFWMLFAREFLQIERYSKFLDGVYKVAVGIFIVGLGLSFAFPGRFMYIVNDLSCIGILSLNLLAGIYTLKRGNANARVFLIAALIFIFGGLFRGIRVAGLQETSWFSESAMPVGMLAEMTILSFALRNRINRIRQENEKEKAMVRSRIASDLHDEIGSNLSSISVASQMIKRSSKLEEAEKEQLEDITATAKETADSIRDIIWFINPEHDKTEDLIFRMRDMAGKLLQGIECSFEAGDGRIIQSKDLQFRRNFCLIFKEILNNIVKHSNATRVCIKLEETSKELRLQVSDNGVGFDENEVDARRGEGIKNLRKRATETGCDLKIFSEPGKGTTVELMVKTA